MSEESTPTVDDAPVSPTVETLPTAATDSAAPAPIAESTPPKGPAPKKAQLSKTLPTARINMAKQFDIIVGYSIAFDKAGHQPVTNPDVASLVGLASATIGMMNAFNLDVGILQRTDNGKFIPSGEARECARMHQINPERAWPKLAPLFEKSWFGEELIAKLRIRSLSENEAVEDLAEIAHAEKDHLPQLKIALDFMEKSGIIVREGGTIKLATQPQRDAVEKNSEEGGTPGKKKDPLDDEEDGDLERHSLTLDPQRKRKIVILTPPTITKKELERIQQWLSFQLIVSE